MAATKTRAWAFIYYPSAKDDAEIFERAEDAKIPMVISPLHDSDKWTTKDQQKNPKHIAGQTKKMHYHGMILFSGPATMAQAQAVIKIFGDACPNYVEPVRDVVTYARYMAHLDQPEKAQYDPDDIRFINGASVSIDKKLTDAEEEKLVKEIGKFILAKGILEYADLFEVALTKKPDWLGVVWKYTNRWSLLFASLRGRSGLKSRNEEY